MQDATVDEQWAYCKLPFGRRDNMNLPILSPHTAALLPILVFLAGLTLYIFIHILGVRWGVVFSVFLHVWLVATLVWTIRRR